MTSSTFFGVFHPPSPPIVSHTRSFFGQSQLTPQCERGRNFWVVPKDDRVVPDAGGVRGYLRLFRRVFRELVSYYCVSVRLRIILFLHIATETEWSPQTESLALCTALSLSVTITPL